MTSIPVLGFGIIPTRTEISTNKTVAIINAKNKFEYILWLQILELFALLALFILQHIPLMHILAKKIIKKNAQSASNIFIAIITMPPFVLSNSFLAGYHK